MTNDKIQNKIPFDFFNSQVDLEIVDGAKIRSLKEEIDSVCTLKDIATIVRDSKFDGAHEINEDFDLIRNLFSWFQTLSEYDGVYFWDFFKLLGEEKTAEFKQSFNRTMCNAIWSVLQERHKARRKEALKNLRMKKSAV